MKYTAVVPARSGSKRLPRKNIKLLRDKPYRLDFKKPVFKLKK